MLHLRTWPAGTWPVAPRRMVSLAFAAALAICLIVLSAGSGMAQGAVRPPANAVGNAGPAERVITTPEKGGSYDIELWQKLRQGVRGSVSIPDKKAGVLVQSGGEGWRLTRRGELPRWGGYALGGMLALLALFFLVRGRIRVDGGLSGIKIERFENLERVAHWLMAVSFIILGLTGLNVLYGREVLMPILGKEAFAGLSVAAKWLHNYVAFAFVAGLILS
ncbi:MAG: formate dehydrogenase subunit gamma, partial [Hyphomicrobiaceae bacterium]